MKKTLFELNQIEIVDIKKIRRNPENPRIIKDDKFRKLVLSIKEFPEMLKLRPVITTNDLMILGGNMRYSACVDAGLTEVPIMRAGNLTPEQQREFIVKDNSSFGEWDWDMILNSWDLDELDRWGVEIPKWLGEDIAGDDDDKKQRDQSKRWFINIEFEDERTCQDYYEHAISQGYKVKIVN